MQSFQHTALSRQFLAVAAGFLFGATAELAAQQAVDARDAPIAYAAHRCARVSRHDGSTGEGGTLAITQRESIKRLKLAAAKGAASAQQTSGKKT